MHSLFTCRWILHIIHIIHIIHMQMNSSHYSHHSYYSHYADSVNSSHFSHSVNYSHYSHQGEFFSTHCPPTILIHEIILVFITRLNLTPISVPEQDPESKGIVKKEKNLLLPILVAALIFVLLIIVLLFMVKLKKAHGVWKRGEAWNCGSSPSLSCSGWWNPYFIIILSGFLCSRQRVRKNHWEKISFS